METFISVDVEAGGCTPAYNLCSIGACEVDNTSNGFYIELKPMDRDRFNSAAGAVGGFSIESMDRNGTDPYTAMNVFDSWLQQFDKPRMVGFNTPFDWQFINYYFWEYLDRNPLGINAIDIKSIYMGFSGCDWKKTTKNSIPNVFHGDTRHDHNALNDAIGQAEMFTKIMNEIKYQKDKM